MSSRTALRWLELVVCAACVLPALDLWRVLRGLNRDWLTAFDFQVFSLGIFATGAWACIFLLLALSVGPASRFFRWQWLTTLRRPLGLSAFGYTALHLLFYVAVGQKWRLDYVWEDSLLVPSRMPGWGAFLLLAPLAATSTQGMIRRLGGKAWKRLHLLVFPATALAIAHLFGTESDRGLGDHHRSRNALLVFGLLIAWRLAARRGGTSSERKQFY